MKRILLILVLYTILSNSALAGNNQISNINRPWTRWWWLGSAVDTTGIRNELNNLQKAGFGGVEITPLYGIKGEEERFIDYLSPQWVNMLKFVIQTAHELDLGVDMNLGTGWPFGGPQISLELAAKKLVISDVPGDSLDKNSPGFITAIKSKDKSDRYTVLSLTGTKQMVKRAAPGAEGLVMDHFSKPAVNTYLARFDKAISSNQFSGLRSLFNDSYEVYNADWTADLFAAFRHYRGYDLADHSSELVGMGDDDNVARIKHDYRETLSDMLLDNFTKSWTSWAHDRNTLTRNQAHGSPANLLDLYAAVDIPETEIYGPSGFDIPGLRTDPDFPSHNSTPPDPLMMKFASSAANVTGKSLASSETFTWLGEHFRTSLSQCKPEIDQLFCAGINHLVFHGTCYSPRDAEWPGWLFYASLQFGPVNSIWRDVQYMNDYIANCQNILQSSEPDNNILLYWPVHDLWQNKEGLMQQFMVHNLNEWLFPTDFYQTAKLLDESGHSFDYITDRQIANLDAIQGTASSHGRQYKCIIVPQTDIIPLATVTKLAELANSGVPVLFHIQFPHDVPGFKNYQKRAKELETIINHNIKIFHTSTDLLTDLKANGILRESLTDQGLQYIRKTMNGMPIYFVTNLSANPVDGWVPFSVQSKSVWLCKTLHCEPGRGIINPINDHQSGVYIQLEPGESIFLLFNFELHQDYTLFRTTGNPLSLTGNWELEFIAGGPELPGPVTLQKLSSWTDLQDPEAKRFAGTGKYTITFTKPDIKSPFWKLDLGVVHESASIKLNGNDLVNLWCFPFHTIVPDNLLKDSNVMEIEITNLAANRIIDMDKRGVAWKKFYDINFVNLNYGFFDASDWDLMPSGLLGPVTLTPLSHLKPEMKKGN